MAEHDITPEVTISKAERRYKVNYVSARHINRPRTTHNIPACTSRATG